VIDFDFLNIHVAENSRSGVATVTATVTLTFFKGS